MFTTTNQGSNYLAKFVTLENVRKHPNADKLQLATVCHQTIIVGENAKEGDVCVYFPLECTINKKFLSFINAFRDSTKNRNKDAKGFFEDKGRVRAVKLRGVVSEGYVESVQNLFLWISSEIGKDITFADSLIEDEFDTIEGIGLLCEKYVIQVPEKGPANMPKLPRKKIFNRIVDGQFHFHVDTAQLKKNIDKISINDTITISYKLHGTSLVASNVLVRRKLSLIEKVARFFGAKIQDTEYDLVYSSRKVLKNAYEVPKTHQHYYKEDIWGAAAKRLKPSLEQGITIYAEIVGQTPNGSWIQKGYDYGTRPCEFEIYVYRITYTSPSGIVREFTTNQMIRYCNKYSLNTVPIMYYGPVHKLEVVNIKPPVKKFHKEVDLTSLDFVADWRPVFLETLLQEVEGKKCRMCNNNVPAEGLVVTVEKDTFEAYKIKTQAFYEMETKALDNNEVGAEE